MQSEHLNLVKAIAGKYARYGVPFEDLMQEGLIGVLEAEKRYNPDKGAKFSTYAGYWVRKRILAFLDTELGYQSRSTVYNEAVLEHSKPELQVEPEVITRPTITLPESMPAEEQFVLRCLYEKELSLSEIATATGLRREKIRQLKQKAMRRLKNFA